ncbi:HTTM domain-containing protein [Wenyingzhuangia sp. 1_MG-2023]|nr:HTTM domain-containing protein [Wenyingzhuangia sp. 1_MG-2023]
MMDFLFKKIDNSPLVIFRIIFGFVLTAEAWGSIFTGWIERTYIEPTIHFSYIGLEWMQPLDGLGMYYLYGLMGFLGLGVLLGYFYKLSIITYTILWTYCYLCHKISYNNHYYLMILLCFIMIFLPANRYASLDVKTKRIPIQFYMPYWCKFVLIFQISCVYFFGGIAKIYPDWLDGTFTRIALKGEASFPFIGHFFTQEWFYMAIAYGGLLFDLLIIPLLICRKTRVFGFVISLFFHSFNSIVFQVGVFPYLSLSFALFFFDAKKIQKIFLPRKEYFNTQASGFVNKRITGLLLLYIMLQLFLPLRQYFIEGNTFWTEEGHKMSWRMMLRTARGNTRFRIEDVTNNKTYIHHPKILSQKQKHLVNTQPDVIWQYAQYLKQEEAKKGHEIKVFCISKKSLNGRPSKTFIDPKVDLANRSWNYFKHNNWITDFEGW